MVGTSSWGSGSAFGRPSPNRPRFSAPFCPVADWDAAVGGRDAVPVRAPPDPLPVRPELADVPPLTRAEPEAAGAARPLAVPVCAAPVCAAPVCAAPVCAAPVCAAPVCAAPVADPVRALPVRALPVRALPVRALPVRALPPAALAAPDPVEPGRAEPFGAWVGPAVVAPAGPAAVPIGSQFLNMK